MTNGSDLVDGSCLCGGVRWTAPAPIRPVLECHCFRCQKLTGNYMAASAAPTEDLTIEEGSLRWYSPDDDPNVAYGFCLTCGSTLFYRAGIADGTNTTTSLAVGTIDGPSGLETVAIWFTSQAADHVRLDRSIPQFPSNP